MDLPVPLILTLRLRVERVSGQLLKVISSPFAKIGHVVRWGKTLWGTDADKAAIWQEISVRPA